MLDSLSCSAHEGELFCKACYGKKFGPKGYRLAGGASWVSMDTGKALEVSRDCRQAQAASTLVCNGRRGKWGGGDSCPRCNKTVYSAEAASLGTVGKKWHKMCLSCAICKKLLDSLSCSDHEGEVFCKGCYGKKFGPKELAGGVSGVSMDNGKAFEVSRENVSSCRQAQASSTLGRNESTGKWGGGASCPRCNKTVYFAEAASHWANDKKWHKMCLSCAICKKMLDSLSCSDHEGEVFCKACYGNKFVPKGYRLAGGASSVSMVTCKAVEVSGEDTPSHNQAPAAPLFANRGGPSSVVSLSGKNGKMSFKDSIVSTRQKQDAQKPTPTCPGISMMKPQFPQYALPSKRQESFYEASKPWPQDAPVGVEKLVEAGFMYPGLEDSVRCFYCGGVFGCWKEGDDPMEEHAKCYPTCQHVLLDKSKRYIKKLEAGESPKADEVVERKEPEMRKEDPLAVPLQTLAEFGFSESDTKIAHNIFKERNGPDTPFKASDLASILMEIEDDPDGYNDNSDATAMKKDSTSQDTEGIDEALDEENQKLEESSMCKICLVNHANMIFLPCHHIVSCPQSAQTLSSSLVCGQSIKGSVKACFNRVIYSRETSEEENKKLKKMMMCKICEKRTVDVVFQPCGHLVVCKGCAPSCKNCCTCRKSLKKVIHIL